MLHVTITCFYLIDSYNLFLISLSLLIITKPKWSTSIDEKSLRTTALVGVFHFLFRSTLNTEILRSDCVREGLGSLETDYLLMLQEFLGPFVHYKRQCQLMFILTLVFHKVVI